MFKNRLIAGLVIFGCCVVGVLYFVDRSPSIDSISEVSVKQSLSTQSGVIVAPDFVTLFKKVEPAVVHISSYNKLNRRDSWYIPGFFDASPAPGINTKRETAIGSGFIISEDGYILTNKHVVSRADEIGVKLSDHREFKATLVGSDTRSDLALLKITGETKFPTVALGKSSVIMPGEWVAAIGSPFNFERSISAGIVSAKNRSLPDEMYVPFFQLDVSVNQGNSGGPLLNLRGEVIGITSHIFSHTGGFMGLSFAIPIDHVVWAVDQLKQHGYVKRGWLGVYLRQVDLELAESLGLKKPIGAMLSKVVKNGPADKAGLQDGDVIVRFNNQEIDQSEMLPVSVGVVSPGSQAMVEYIRTGKKMTTNVEVGELVDERVAMMNLIKNNAIDNGLGIVVERLMNNDRINMGIGNKETGVVVKKISRDGVGRKIGLNKQDVITDLAGVQIISVEGFFSIVASLPSKVKIPMRIIRNGSAKYLTFWLE